MPQIATPSVPFHIEHIIARQHRGSDASHNLALACDRCNAYKGPNLTAVDPYTNRMTPLFHPRQQAWAAHFRTDHTLIIGTSQTGRATVALLRMNDERRQEVRALLLQVDLWPPAR